MRGESVYMCVREREKKNIDAKTMKYFHIWNMIVFSSKFYILYDYGMNAQFLYKQILVATNCKE